MKEALLKQLVIGLASSFVILSSVGACSSSKKNEPPPDEGSGGSGGTGGGGGTGGEGGDPGSTGGSGGTGGDSGSGGTGGEVTEAECQSNSDCDDGERCDPFLDECVECLYDSHCANGQQCVRQSCTSIDECGNSLDCPDDQVCDSVRGRCVECLSDEDCGDDAACENNLCVPVESCTNSLDCSGNLVCDTSRDRCVRCVSSNDCGGNNTTCYYNTCRLYCSSDTNCRGLGMLCDTSLGVCVNCVTGNDCPTAYHCFEGSCRLDVCEPGSAYCGADDLLYECNAAGSGYEGYGCGSGYSCVAANDYEASCERQVCTPGATECDTSFESIIECSDDGLEIENTISCGDQICYQGACEDLECPPSTYLCVGNERHFCYSDGMSSYVVEYCDQSNEYCNPASADCEPLLCQPDEPACNGSLATTCNSTGDGYEDGGTDCADSDQVCVAGDCADCNNTVLFLGDSDSYGNSVWVSAMTAAGLDVTQIDDGIQTYSGTPAADTFGAIVLHTAISYSGLPSTGQTAIADAQAAGTGLIFNEWASYAVYNSYWTYLSSLTLLSYSSYTTGYPTFTLTDTGHPIWDGLPTYWTSTQYMYVTWTQLVNGGVSIATCDLCGDTGSYSGSAVAVRNDGGGRIVHIAHWGNYSTAYYDTNLVTLNTNAAQWAAACK